ncbi:MAG: ammonium transporter, partial [Desulfovibrio sp.]|nr:ammonium transporter [Desulfovibrio sp.]
GALAGLVAITPAAGFVTLGASMFMGFAGGMVCYAGVLLKNRFHYDDALDVVGIHGIGGTLGAILTGVFASAQVNGVNGLLYGNPRQLFVQALSVVAAWGYVYLASRLILLLVDKTVGLRADPDEEATGLDLNEHHERGYSL